MRTISIYEMADVNIFSWAINWMIVKLNNYFSFLLIATAYRPHYILSTKVPNVCQLFLQKVNGLRFYPKKSKQSVNWADYSRRTTYLRKKNR